MAESPKAKPSSANQKKKSSFLDDEIGDDFLGSWKSMSVMKDDGMDFSFDTGSKSKKKVFDFDKLDMGFNLDSDFNKISSFKMDMSDFDISSPPKKDAKTKEVHMSDLDLSSPPKKASKIKEVEMSDLDLSSPPKKAAKSKERSEEEPSRGSRQGKQDHFKFSFDFNELDSFDLDSTLSRREKCSKNQVSSKENASDEAGSKGSKVDLAECVSTLDGVSETMATSKIDAKLVDPGSTNSKMDYASESETSENFELPPDHRCQENLMSKSTQESNQQSHLPAKEISVEPYAEQTTHDLAAELVGVDANGDAGVDGKNLEIKNVNAIPSEKEAVNEKMLIGGGPSHENSSIKDSSQLVISNVGSSSADRGTSASDTLTENDGPAKDDLDNGETLATLVSRKIPHDIRSFEGTQNSTLQFPLSTQASESTADKIPLREESGAGEHCLKNPMIMEDTEPQLYQPALIGATSVLSGKNKISSMYLHPVIEKGVSVATNDSQHGRKLFPRLVVADEKTKVRPVIPQREGSDSDGAPNGTNLVGYPQLCDEEITAKEPVIGSEQRKNLNGHRVHVIPSSSTEKTRKLGSQSLKPKIILPIAEPVRNSKISITEGNQHCPEKPAEKKTNMSTWKMSKNIGGSNLSLISAPQKEVKSQRSSKQNKELEGNVDSETRQIVDGSEKMPQNLPLKRKTFEGLSPGLASLKPLKRLSLSPRETRNFTEPSKAACEQVGTHENRFEIMTKSPSSRLGSPCMTNLMELQLPSAMETDENVEKAEAYTKELEDICNMLKKKHDEAKEILVRAVVNNNNLLMLNHPIYEAKIFIKFRNFLRDWHIRSFKHVKEDHQWSIT